MHKLCQKLKTKEYLEDEIKETISRLIDEKYLDDERMAKRVIRTLVTRGKSRSYIISKLRFSGLTATKELLFELFDENQEEAELAVKKLIEKKYQQLLKRGLAPYQISTKILQHLYSKGLTDQKYRTYIRSITHASPLVENCEEC